MTDSIQLGEIELYTASLVKIPLLVASQPARVYAEISTAPSKLVDGVLDNKWEDEFTGAPVVVELHQDRLWCSSWETFECPPPATAVYYELFTSGGGNRKKDAVSWTFGIKRASGEVEVLTQVSDWRPPFEKGAPYNPLGQRFDAFV